MVDLMVSALVVAGVLSMILLPLAVLEMIRVTRDRARLEQRNVAQALTIAQLERRLGVHREPDRSGSWYQP